MNAQKIIKRHNKHIQQNLKLLKQHFITHIRCFIFLLDNEISLATLI